MHCDSDNDDKDITMMMMMMMMMVMTYLLLLLKNQRPWTLSLTRITTKSYYYFKGQHAANGISELSNDNLCNSTATFEIIWPELTTYKYKQVTNLF